MNTTKPVIIIGSGGHAKVLVDALQSIGNEILFCTDVDPARFGQSVLGILVAGGDVMIGNHSPDSIELVNGLGSIGIPELRHRVALRWKNAGFAFRTLIHPSATISSTAAIESGVQVMAGAVIQTSARIGDSSIINTHASVDHDCVIGACCHIGPGATLSGGVQIGELCHMGTGARIIQNIRIGSGVLIGAGATVIRDVPDNTTVVGTPATRISSNASRISKTHE